jgi:hypothetical protein
MSVDARRSPPLGLLLGALVAVVATGCSVQRVPISLDASLDTASIAEILVLPVIDARPARLDQVQIARNVGDAVGRLLREHGYFVVEADRFEARPPEALDVRTAEAGALGPLAPADATHMLVVQVDRLERTVDESGEGWIAGLSAALVDRPGNRVLWRDAASAESSLSGMLTVFSRGSRQYEAAVNATRLLLNSLPKKKTTPAT